MSKTWVGFITTWEIPPYQWWGPVVQTPVGTVGRCSCSTHRAGCRVGCSPQRKCADRGWGKGCWQVPHGHGWYYRHTSPGRHLLHCHHPGRRTALRTEPHTPWRHWMPFACQSLSPRWFQSAKYKDSPVDKEDILHLHLIQIDLIFLIFCL